MACFHEMLEWLGPAKEMIDNMSFREFTMRQTLALANIQIGLIYVEKGLNELDRVAQE